MRSLSATGRRRLGSLADSGRIVGDIVSPVAGTADWESLADWGRELANR